MKTMRIPCAKIVLHSEGLGTPTPENVRQRALELARIDGRLEMNDRDWERAKHEVHGAHPFLWNADGETDMIESVSERDMVATDNGHHVENMADDTEFAIEELVFEGLDEAVHDRMLAAARMQEEEEELAEME